MRRPVLVAVLLLVALGVGAAGVAVALDEDEPIVVTVASEAFAPYGSGEASDLAPVLDFGAGEALVPELAVYDQPAPPAGTAPFTVQSNPTWEGRALVVAVHEQSPDGEWLRVQLPMRPNETTGWVRASEIRQWRVPNRIDVSVTTNTLVVYRGTSDEVLFTAPVATGKPSTPTPLGSFYIDIVNPLGHDRIYGWGQLSVAAFSHIWRDFMGGIGQMAIHGWNNPSVIGQSVSNGCIRMKNEDIEQLATFAPLGTPVTVHE